MNYFTYEKEKFTCKNCNWSGLGNEALVGEYFNAGFEIDCPNCGGTLPGLIGFTSLEETVLKGNEYEKKRAQEQILLRERFRAARLENAEQLPDIEGENLTFHMSEADEGDDEILIFKYEGQEVWREMCYYEYYERYIEIAEIMIEKYGSKLKDIVPKVNGIYFYGDTLKSPAVIKEFRKKNFKQYER